MKPPGPLVPRPVRIGGDQDELIGPLRIRKFQAVDSGRFAGFFPALGRIFEGVPVSSLICAYAAKHRAAPMPGGEEGEDFPCFGENGIRMAEVWTTAVHRDKRLDSVRLRA